MSTDMPGGYTRAMAGPSTHVDHETDEPDDNDDSRPDWLARGQTIGRYVVIECLGVGGMGVIYSAWDPKLDRKLAIKIVRDRNGRLSSDRSRVRLLREGQALARLRHANVITVHDVGTHDGRVFVAMEFVEGQTLQQWLLRSPRPPLRELIDVFLQVGRGLAAAHRAGLVHRDIKPENMMIGDDGRVLVLDFGIARDDLVSDSGIVVERPEPEPETVPHVITPDSTARAVSEFAQDHSPLPSLTRVGAVIGTPAYMSPEQHRGQGVDSRSDQFSFCVAMWEALHGDKPFGEGSRQKLLARMRLGHVRSTRNREVPRRINVALRRGLSWQPGDRFETMEELLEALNPRGHRAEQRLWRGLALGSAAGVIVGVLATIVSLGLQRAKTPGAPAHPSCARVGDELVWNESRATSIAGRFDATGLERTHASWIRTRERLDHWTARWFDARTAACRSHFVEQRDSAALHDQRVACLSDQRRRFDALIEVLETSDPLVLDGAITAAAELPAPELCSDAEHLRQLERAPPQPSSSSARQRVAELELELDRVELHAASSWRLGLEHSRQLTAAAREAHHPPLLARALLIQATHLDHAGDQTEAEALLLEAATAAAVAGAPDMQARALAHAARVINDRGRPLEAQRWLELGRAVASQSAATSSLIVELDRTEAAVAQSRGHIERARTLLSSLATRLERDGDPRLELPIVLHQLGNLEAAVGDGREAVELLRRALVLQEQAKGPHDVHIPTFRSDLAFALVRIGEGQAALGEYARALELSQTLHGRGRETALIRSRLARAQAQIGHCDAARDTLALALAEARSDAPRSLALAVVLETSARVCIDDLAKARAWAREAVELREHVEGRSHPDLAGALAVEALVLLAVDEPEAARALIERARELADELPPDDARACLVDAADGLSLTALGRPDEGKPVLERVRPLLADDVEMLARIDAALAERSQP